MRLFQNDLSIYSQHGTLTGGLFAAGLAIARGDNGVNGFVPAPLRRLQTMNNPTAAQRQQLNNPQIALAEWYELFNLTPERIAFINSAVGERYVIGDPEDGLPIPIGLTIITGKAGTGKTSFLEKEIVPLVTHQDQRFLRFGEPGTLCPYSLRNLYTAIDHAIFGGTPGVQSVFPVFKHAPFLFIDSLMGMWFDPSITGGFGTGRGGASLGVPAMLSLIDNYAVAHGLRVVAVLHPVFADPELITSGISGVSSLYINMDDNSWIVRDYTPIDPRTPFLDYRRRSSEEDRSSLRSLIKNMGDED